MIWLILAVLLAIVLIGFWCYRQWRLDEDEAYARACYLHQIGEGPRPLPPGSVVVNDISGEDDW